MKLAALAALAAVYWTMVAPPAQAPDAPLPAGTSCKDAAPAPRSVGGRPVGIEDCTVVAEETVFDASGRPHRRIEITLNGAIAGYAVRSGPAQAYFTCCAEFSFGQTDTPGPYLHGIGRYEGAKGTGMTLIYPAPGTPWNGKLFVTAHGAGSYTPVGDLIPRDPSRPFNALAGANKFVGIMIDRGYAVAHTRRSAARLRGDSRVTLDDGTVLEDRQFSDHAGLFLEFTELAERMLAARLERRPTHTYFYGHSAGGRLGRLINYAPDLNRGADGRPVFDGILADDAGAGLWLPFLKRDGVDTLFGTEAARERFVKQIDLVRLLYLGETNDYLDKKHENARLLHRKGLAARHREYEVAGVSHFDRGQSSRLDLVHQTIDLGGVMEAVIDLLDRWVVDGIEPPPSKTAVLALGDADGDGVNENPPIALPEVACPRGVYYIFPALLGAGRPATQQTGYAAFDGVNEEPIDGRGVFVDMNGNSVRDRRETIAEAWRRLGLLKAGEALTQDHYAGCVGDAARRLARARLLPPRFVDEYVRQARTTPLDRPDAVVRVGRDDRGATP